MMWGDFKGFVRVFPFDPNQCPKKPFSKAFFSKPAGLFDSESMLKVCYSGYFTHLFTGLWKCFALLDLGSEVDTWE